MIGRVVFSYRLGSVKREMEKILFFLGLLGDKDVGRSASKKEDDSGVNKNEINEELYRLFKPYMSNSRPYPKADVELLKQEYVDKPGSTFYDRIRRRLSHGSYGIGGEKVGTYIDEVISHIKMHHDIFIRSVEKRLLGVHRDYTTKDPEGIIEVPGHVSGGKEDGNIDKFVIDKHTRRVDTGLELKMEVLREHTTDKYRCTVKFRGTDIDETVVYDLDTSTSKLYLEEGQVYRVKLESMSGKKIKVHIEGATRGWEESTKIPVRMINNVLDNGVDDFKKTKYKEEMVTDSERSQAEMSKLMKGLGEQEKLVESLDSEVTNLRKNLGTGDFQEIQKRYNKKKEELLDETELLEDIRRDIHELHKVVVPEMSQVDWGPKQRARYEEFTKDLKELREKDERFRDELDSKALPNLDWKKIFKVVLSFDDPYGDVYEPEVSNEPVVDVHERGRNIGPGGLGHGVGERSAPVTPEMIEDYEEELKGGISGADGKWTYGQGDKAVSVPYSDILLIFSNAIGIGHDNMGVEGWRQRFEDGLSHYAELHVKHEPKMERFIIQEGDDRSKNKDVTERFIKDMKGIIRRVPRFQKLHEDANIKRIQKQLDTMVVKGTQDEPVSEEELRKRQEESQKYEEGLKKDILEKKKREESPSWGYTEEERKENRLKVEGFAKEMRDFWLHGRDFGKLADIYRRIQKAISSGLKVMDQDYRDLFWVPTNVGLHKFIQGGHLEEAGKLVRSLKGILPEARYNLLEKGYKSGLKSVEFGRLLADLWKNPGVNLGKLMEIYSELGREFTDLTGHVWDNSVHGFKVLLDRDYEDAMKVLRQLSGESYMDRDLVGFFRESILAKALKAEDKMKVRLWGLYRAEFKEDGHKTQDEITMYKRLTNEVAHLISMDDSLEGEISGLGVKKSPKERGPKKERGLKEKKFQQTKHEEVLEERAPGEKSEFDTIE
jgi:hypothetical protein